MKAHLAVALWTLSVMTALPVYGHHSFGAMFDENKPAQFKGIVTRVEWANPHVYFYVDVKDDKGKVTNWGFETNGPGGLIRQGWKRDSLKAGDQVSVQGYLAKDGSRLADARQVTFADERKVFAGTAGDGGPTDPSKKP